MTKKISSFNRLSGPLNKKLYALAIACMVFTKAGAQCAGAVPDNGGFGNSVLSPPSYNNNYYDRSSSYVPTGANINMPVITVNITLHIFTPSAPNQNTGIFQETNDPTNGLPRLNYLLSLMTDGTGERYSGPRLETSSYNIPNLNIPFIHDSRIQYHVTNIYFYNNTTAYTTDFYASLFAQSTVYGLIGAARMAEGMPIILNAGNNAGADPNVSAVFSSVGNDEYLFTRQLMHEIGHCFGLGHPYWGHWYGLNNPSNDHTPANENLSCSPSNDRLDDLFPMNNPNCPANTPPNPPTEVSECNSCYENVNFGTNNIMSDHNTITPKDWMSPLQMGRRLKALHLSRIRMYAADMESEHAHPLEINADEVWDFNTYMYRDIVVKTGHKLTVGLGANIAMARGGKIIIEKGAQLILDGGELTGWCKKGLWEGIEVEGMNSGSQLIYTSGANAGYAANQGILRILNNGTISRATIGVKTCRTDDFGSMIWSSRGGGIIISKDAIFNNNVRDVKLMEYAVANSVTSFINSRFITSGAIGKYTNGATAEPLVHATLWGVAGVKFLGCEFAPYQSFPDPGVGIYSCDAVYTVDQYNGASTTFSYLRKGIEVVNTNPLKVVSVTNCKFIENTDDGVYFQNMDNFVFSDNLIKPAFSNGLYVFGCKNYLIKNNTITGYSTGLASTGMYVNNSTDGSHYIYKNKITKCAVGVGAVGNNSSLGNMLTGLKINCNDFSGTPNDCDVAMFHGSHNNYMIPPTVHVTQGLPGSDPKKYVRNIYGAPSNCPGCENQWLIEGISPRAITHASNSDANTQPSPQPDFGDIALSIIPGLPLSYATHCPSNPPALGLGNDLSNPANATQRLTNTNGYLVELMSIKEEYRDYFEMQAATAAQLNIYITDSLLHNNDSVIAILERNVSAMPDADVMAIYAYMDKGDLVTAQAKTDALSSKKEGWKTVLTRQIEYKADPESLYNLSDRESDLAALTPLVVYDTIQGSASVRSALQFFGKKIFSPEKPLPNGGNARLMSSQTENANNEKQSLLTAIANSIKVYPNPASETVNLSYQNTEGKNLQVTLTDALGRKVYETTIKPASVTEVSLAGMANGVYLLNVYDNKASVYQTKVICIK